MITMEQHKINMQNMQRIEIEQIFATTPRSVIMSNSYLMAAIRGK